MRTTVATYGLACLLLGGSSLLDAKESQEINDISYYDRSAKIVIIRAKVEDLVGDRAPLVIRRGNDPSYFARFSFQVQEIVWTSYPSDGYLDETIRMLVKGNKGSAFAPAVWVEQEGALPILSDQEDETGSRFLVLTYNMLVPDVPRLLLLSEPSSRKVENFLVLKKREERKKSVR